MPDPRKRSRDAYEASHDHDSSLVSGAGENDQPGLVAQESDGRGQQKSEEWQTVEPRGKKRKKHGAEKSYPAITHSSHARLQSFVKISDLQSLVLYLLADGNSPQWCSVRHHANVRKVVVLMVPGLEMDMFNHKIPLSPTLTNEGSTKVEPAVADMTNGSCKESEVAPETARSGRIHVSPDDYYPVRLVQERLPEPLQPLAETFEYIWPIKTPGEDRNARMHSPLAAMLVSPIVKPKDEKKSKGPQFPAEGRSWKNQATPITQFLTSTQELIDEGYVLHPALYSDLQLAAAEVARREASKTTVADGWIDLPQVISLEEVGVHSAKTQDSSLTAGRKVLAMDCEMCITSPPGVSPQVFSLTRVSLIDWDGKTVLDEFVKPKDPITDYLTPYSGITAASLEGVSTTLADIQAKLKEIFTLDSILIGHSLNSDLNALKITHPFIVDTAILYPHPRGPPLKSSLKWLSQKYLGREIQKGHGSTGHDSIEDARACLDLVKQKCEKGKTWGTSEASGESIFKRIGRATRPGKHTSDTDGHEEHRSGAVIDWGEPSRGYGGAATVAIGAESDAGIVDGVRRAVNGDDSIKANDEAAVVQIPSGGCDLVWARLRELEAYRGWWSRSKVADTDSLRSAATETSSATSLSSVTARTVEHIRQIHESLPACTAFIVYSGSGDPRELQQLQEMQKKFKEEYRVKKWDQLSVKWTDTEEQQLKQACEKARKGCGFITVK